MSNRFPRPASPLIDGVIALREWREDDVPALVASAQDHQLPRFTRFPAPYTEQDARDFLAGRVVDEVGFAIVEAPDGTLLGGIGLRDAGEGRGQVGYWVAAPARGRGVATRALRLVCGWAFGELGLARLQLLTDPDNHASQRVAERAGFRREGVLRSYMDFGDRRRDGVMYGLLAADLDREAGPRRE